MFLALKMGMHAAVPYVFLVGARMGSNGLFAILRRTFAQKKRSFSAFEPDFALD
jgi:hypothetical protein